MNENRVLKDDEIATLFVSVMIEGVNKNWPILLSQLTETWGNDKLLIEDKNMAKMDFFIALFSLELRSIANIHSLKMAHVVRSCFLSGGESPDMKSTYLNEIETFQQSFEEGIRKASITALNNNPMDSVSIKLLTRWTGENIKKLYVKNFNMVNPLIVLHVNNFISKLLGGWSRFIKHLDTLNDKTN
ncbi:MAG: hypothetical protein HYT97_00275 [Elusimicrobia bacterium]|nr:hypothetical protein [Elusimicrobiota bacterium]